MKKTFAAALAMIVLTFVPGICNAAPPPEQRGILSRFLLGARVHEPWHEGSLTIYPVSLGGIGDVAELPTYPPRRIKPAPSVIPPAWPDVETLDRAVARGDIEVRELGRVDRVLVGNHGPRIVFAMAGEMLGKGRQDRMISEDVLIPPRGKVEVAVYCVEPGRWAGDERFAPMAKAVSPQVRQAARATSSQSEVWSSVRSAQARLGAPPTAGPGGTTSYRTIYESRDVQKRLRGSVEKMAGLPAALSSASGVVVAVEGRFLVADIFANPRIFGALWHKLLESYAADALAPSVGGEMIDSRGDALRVLRRALDAQISEKPYEGLGELVELRGLGLVGSALFFRDWAAHLELFPGAKLVMERRVAPLQYRRERLQGQVER
jgi:hypothetical protein